MSKPDREALQQQYSAAYLRSGISLEAWCDEQGLVYNSVRRYVKKPHKNAQSAGEKFAQNAQKKVRKTAQKTSAQNAQKPAGKIHEIIAPAPEHVMEIDVFEPELFGLSSKQGKFAHHYFEGKNPTEAYRLSGYEGEGKVAWAAASRMLRNVKVQRAIRWLRDRRQKRLALTEQEIIHQLSSIASADPNLISHIRRVNCRYCWGDDHHYQWRDVDEYERACASTLAESRPPPAFDGGIGFVETTIPNEACPRCNGDGQMDLFFADTSMLDGPERWLVTGVEQTMNGLKVRMASPEAARKELLAYIKATRRVIPGDSGQPATDKESLEIKGLELRNEKLQAEIENIRKSKNDSNLVVVHNAMQVPEDSQSDQDESDIEE